MAGNPSCPVEETDAGNQRHPGEEKNAENRENT
jgi:hypothetical protein